MLWPEPWPRWLYVPAFLASSSPSRLSLLPHSLWSRKLSPAPARARVPPAAWSVPPSPGCFVPEGGASSGKARLGLPLPPAGVSPSPPDSEPLGAPGQTEPSVRLGWGHPRSSVTAGGCLGFLFRLPGPHLQLWHQHTSSVRARMSTRWGCSCEVRTRAVWAGGRPSAGLGWSRGEAPGAAEQGAGAGQRRPLPR